MRQQNENLPEKPVLLFDGVCNLCNGVVQFVINHDTRGQFRFASLQSEAGQALLRQHRLSTTNFDTFILLEEGRIFTRSSAALRIARKLNGFWPLLYMFMVIPKFIRDFFYNLVSRNRYRWFGQQEACMLPTPELKSRFL